MSQAPKLYLAFCTHKSAAFAVEHWHYSRKMPVGKANYIGVWENDVYIGVVMFSRGNTPHIGRAFGLDQTQIIELTRIALNRHQTHVTRIMRIALAMVKKHNPNLQAVISYADQTQGHEGLIYHAGGWTYLGTTPKLEKYTDGVGIYHTRVCKVGGETRQFGRMTKVRDATNMTKIFEPGKHKFIWWFDSRIRKEFHAKFHTRRKHHGDALDDQSRESGSIPTAPLAES